MFSCNYANNYIYMYLGSMSAYFEVISINALVNIAIAIAFRCFRYEH